MNAFPHSFRALLLLGALPMALAAQRDGDRIDTTLTLNAGGLVQLGVVSGEIRVTASNRRDVRIRASIDRGRWDLSASRSGIALQSRSVNSRQSGATITVEVPVGTRVIANSTSGLIDVRGTMSEVAARTTSGRIQVHGARTRLEVRTISGSLELRDVQGRMSIEGTSTSIDLENASGDLTAETVSGSIRIRRSALTNLRARTTSGTINYEGSLSPTGSYTLNTHSGSITMALPANVGARLELETFSGRISSDFPLTLQPGQSTGRGRRMEFTLGDGRARVSAGAFSGNINLRRGSAAADRE
ncbi:MAG: DUF4097 family beta strand repeat protein [Gemmatimonadaceae bacterium]|nr:DUF4097 family beta strand repeat protein [Gemmatimonadaceae bacterium]MCW5826531.1 DUF4097 family beta strand repeat protein [Gemmatimonadaceae bacterium]